MCQLRGPTARSSLCATASALQSAEHEQFSVHDTQSLHTDDDCSAFRLPAAIMRGRVSIPDVGARRVRCLQSQPFIVSRSGLVQAEMLTCSAICDRLATTSLEPDAASRLERTADAPCHPHLRTTRARRRLLRLADRGTGASTRRALPRPRLPALPLVLALVVRRWFANRSSATTALSWSTASDAGRQGPSANLRSEDDRSVCPRPFQPDTRPPTELSLNEVRRLR